MEFKHPKYYAALRAERRKLQAASDKPQAYQINYDDFCKGDEEKPQASSSKPQASSPKRQASSFRTNLLKLQATSFKRQAASVKLQA